MSDRRRPFWATAWAGAALLMVCGPQQVYGQCSEAKLTAPDGAADDLFGISVSISGDVAVVGTPWNENGPNSGSAYVFRHDGPSWVQESKITASDGAAEDRFGLSVSTDGELAVVGAYLDDDSGEDSGSAYEFGVPRSVNAAPIDFEVTRGVYVEGGLFSLMESDDRYLLVAARRPPYGAETRPNCKSLPGNEQRRSCCRQPGGDRPLDMIAASLRGCVVSSDRWSSC